MTRTSNRQLCIFAISSPRLCSRFIRLNIRTGGLPVECYIHRHKRALSQRQWRVYLTCALLHACVQTPTQLNGRRMQQPSHRPDKCRYMPPHPSPWPWCGDAAQTRCRQVAAVSRLSQIYWRTYVVGPNHELSTEIKASLLANKAHVTSASLSLSLSLSLCSKVLLLSHSQRWTLVTYNLYGWLQ